MKSDLRTKEALRIENSSQRDICSETEVNPIPSSGLTQQMSNLIIENRFHNTPGSILLIPDTADKLYKMRVLEHLSKETKVRYIYGPVIEMGRKHRGNNDQRILERISR